MDRRDEKTKTSNQDESQPETKVKDRVRASMPWLKDHGYSFILGGLGITFLKAALRRISALRKSVKERPDEKIKTTDKMTPVGQIVLGALILYKVIFKK